MELNSIKPAQGAKKESRRVGRGIGSGFGKTCGRGHKGLKSRSGGKVAIGFEGGQMPVQRRLPKRGFKSLMKVDTAHVRTSELAKIDAKVINLAALKEANLISARAKAAKVFLSGELAKKVEVQGLLLTKGAKAAIESAGGKIVES